MRVNNYYETGMNKAVEQIIANVVEYLDLNRGVIPMNEENQK